MNQKIIMIYQDFLEEVNKLDSNDAHNLVTLVRTFFRRPSDVEKLLPDFDERVGNELNLLTEQYVESAEVRELAEWMLDQTGAQNDNPQIQYAFIASYSTNQLFDFRRRRMSGGQVCIHISQMEAFSYPHRIDRKIKKSI
jgi:hypothetical protein